MCLRTPGGPGRLGQQPPFWPGKSRAGRGLRGPWCPAPGAARGALVLHPRTSHRCPRGPGSRRGLRPGACGCLPMPSLGSTHLVIPPLPLPSPPLSTGLLSLFPSRHRSELLSSAGDQSLPPRKVCLLGEPPGPSCRPLPLPRSARSVGPGPPPHAPRPGPPGAPEGSPRARTRSCLLLRLLRLPLGWGGREGGGLRAALPGALFYPFNSSPFPFLLCVTFAYLLIYSGSGALPSRRGLLFPSGLSAGTSAPPGQLLPAARVAG